MAYTPTTWAVGDTITAAKLNNIEDGISEAAQSGGGGWDAVVRLTHTEDSGGDDTSHLTPSIVSGTFAGLESMAQNSQVPHVLIEYAHPWGTVSAMPVAKIGNLGGSTLELTVAGFFTSSFRTIGTLSWANNDTIGWI